jgi:hypothetical protein
MEPTTRVLVTGGCGFLGTAIVSALVRTKRYAITVIDVNPPSLGSTTFTNSVRYVRCDIMDPTSLCSVFSEASPTVVVHTVGVFPLGSKRYSMRGKSGVFKINVEGTRNVVEASKECGAKAFVYTSSVTVVLDELDRDFRDVDERWPTGGAHTSYGQSKVPEFPPFCCVFPCSADLYTPALVFMFLSISASSFSLTEEISDHLHSITSQITASQPRYASPHPKHPFLTSFPCKEWRGRETHAHLPL